MNVQFLTLLLIVLVVLYAQAQFDDHDQTEEDPQQQQQTLTLTRESLEALLQMLSPTCRTEMEGAIGNNGDVSMECRREIQEGLISLNIAPNPMGKESTPEGQFQRGQQRQQDDSTPRETNVTSEKNGQQAMFAILGFVVLLFGSAGAYVVYYNKNAPTEAKKAKKLSKKKVSYAFISCRKPINH